MEENKNEERAPEVRHKDTSGEGANSVSGYQGYPVSGGGNNNDISRGTLTWLDMAALIGVFFVANIAGGLLGGLIRTTTKVNHEFTNFIAYVVTFSLAIIFALWQRRRRGAPELLKLSVKKTNLGLVLWGFILVMVTSIVLEPLLELFPSIGMEILYDSIGTGVWAVITTVVMASIMEEILFRGIIQQSLTEQFGGWKSVLAASAIFAVVHLIPQQMVNAFFVGIILGYIYIKTGSVLSVILIHAMNNAMAFLQMRVFGTETQVTIRQLIGNDTTYWIVYALFCGIFVWAMLNLWKQLKIVPADEDINMETKRNGE